MTSVCRLTIKLIEDEPGCHTYTYACRDCGREVGPEWVVPHQSLAQPHFDAAIAVAACPAEGSSPVIQADLTRSVAADSVVSQVFEGSGPNLAQIIPSQPAWMLECGDPSIGDGPLESSREDWNGSELANHQDERVASQDLPLAA